MNENLLQEYKKYDYLNQSENNPLVKILVSYIKPAFLFKSEILTPIHLGKGVEKENSKDGVQSESDLKWLHENCEFNDDFEGGISEHNRRIGFFTGTYWAWKNYEKLGNPNYFGSFGYRRLFEEKSLSMIKNYDIISPKARKIETTYEKRLIDYLGENFYYKTINILKKHNEKDFSQMHEYLNQNSIYFDEIYIMKKEHFFNFCEWIYSILQDLLNIEQDNTVNSLKLTTKEILHAKGETRDLAYIMEFLTGYYIYKIKNTLKIYEADTILLYKDKTQNIFEILRKRTQNVKN